MAVCSSTRERMFLLIAAQRKGSNRPRHLLTVERFEGEQR